MMYLPGEMRVGKESLVIIDHHPRFDDPDGE